jgi:hypothetical protein
VAKESNLISAELRFSEQSSIRDGDGRGSYADQTGGVRCYLDDTITHPAFGDLNFQIGFYDDARPRAISVDLSHPIKPSVSIGLHRGLVGRQVLVAHWYRLLNMPIGSTKRENAFFTANLMGRTYKIRLGDEKTPGSTQAEYRRISENEWVVEALPPNDVANVYEIAGDDPWSGQGWTFTGRYHFPLSATLSRLR